MITDTEARKIASEWHGGGGTALYAFSSTGAIDTARANHDIRQEILNDFASTVPGSDDAKNLIDLLKYTVDHRTRGPVDGWSSLTW